MNSLFKLMLWTFCIQGFDKREMKCYHSYFQKLLLVPEKLLTFKRQSLQKKIKQKKVLTTRRIEMNGAFVSDTLSGQYFIYISNEI